VADLVEPAGALGYPGERDEGFEVRRDQFHAPPASIVDNIANYIWILGAHRYGAGAGPWRWQLLTDLG